MNAPPITPPAPMAARRVMTSWIGKGMLVVGGWVLLENETKWRLPT